MERCTLFYNGEAFTSATLSSTTAITTLTKYTILNPKSTKQGVYYIWTPRHKPTSLIKNFTLSTNQLKVKKKN